jgi:ectoine hydroxylase-related dioxygenase (phytanoyl-CoA dioxygenase family)
MQALTDALRAADLKWISGYVSIKESHQSSIVVYRRMAPQIALPCYLVDTNVQNGALRVLRGSHRKSTPIHAVLPEAPGNPAEDLKRSRQ